MNKNIPQDHQNEKQISSSIRRFFVRFHISSVLKASNAYKKKGTPVVEIFQYLFLLIFSNRSMYMDFLTGRNNPSFAKDTIYRFMKMAHINWIRFTTLLAAGIIRDAIAPLDCKDRVNVLTIDDSLFDRSRSKKVELLSRVYDHAKHVYRYGFRMLTLGWSDGATFLPVSSLLLSSENKKNRMNEAGEMDKRTCGYKRRVLSQTKGTEAMLELLKAAKTTRIPADYVLFDSWFSSPKTLHTVKGIGYDIIAMIKKSSKMYFRYNGEDVPLTEVYKRNRKRPGRSKYRISTDITLSEEEIIRIYGKRWDIEVFFKVCKSYLGLSRECSALSYDAITAHTAIVFARYMMLSVENRESRDERSLGELFLYFTDEMADITWLEGFHLLMEMFRELLADTCGLSEDKIDELMDAFMEALSSFLKLRLKAA